MSYTESLPKECVLDRLQAMILQEQKHYNYESYFPAVAWEDMERQSQLNSSWREKICQWSYNVVDHFDLPREVVAVSLDLFDRYLATRGNQCSGNMALLASLTTLHIAIKVHSEKNIKLTTLASLSRGQFESEHIEQMEWRIMNALGWQLHPPTLFAFVSHLLMLFPGDVHHLVRKELFEVAIYMAELSVCDSFFVKYPASAVAMAAIINVMDDMPIDRLSTHSRDAFWATLSCHVKGFHPGEIGACRDHLRCMFSATGPTSTQPASDYYDSTITYSPTSAMDMQLDEQSIVKSGSSDTQDQFRYSPSPPTCHRLVSCPISSSRIGTSPIVASMQYYS
jgi:Cyclin, N-terminal domain/Cyclin, C-terminal domain